MNLAILILLLTSPQFTAGNLLLSMSMPAALIPVTVKVDFGPAGKPSVQKEFTIKDHSTPKEALSKVLPIEEGAICCHPAEVKAIDGVSGDPMKNRWWRLKINGSEKKASPHKSHLKAGDVVEWIYFEDRQ